MAQDVKIANITYSDVPAIEIPKATTGTALFTDTSPTTAVASDVASGKYFFTASGQLTLGSASGGTAAISVVDTTDSHGGTVRTITAVDISDTTAVASDVASGKYFYTADGTKTAGTASGGGGGLEYETGTWIPTTDTNNPSVSFTNTHNSRPYSVIVEDITDTEQSIANGLLSWTYIGWYDAFGVTCRSGNSGTPMYGRIQYSWGGSSYGASGTNLSSTTGMTTSSIDRYVTDEGFQLYSCKCIAGRTYKWIAVWAPTT